MRSFMKYISAFIAFILLGSICGCSVLNNDPPTVADVQTLFDRDKDALQLVTNYCISTGYTNIRIYDDCETVRADGDEIHIDDVAVISAVKRLRNSGYKTISKNGNTIRFVVWSRFNDAGCGIAYSIDGKEISVEYMTASAPLAEDDWYYYVDDFNEWRSQNDS